MNNLKYLQDETAKLLNLYNANLFDEVVKKGKILIKKFPDQILFYIAKALSFSPLEKQEDSLKILKQPLNLNLTIFTS